MPRCNTREKLARMLCTAGIYCPSQQNWESGIVVPFKLDLTKAMNHPQTVSAMCHQVGLLMPDVCQVDAIIGVPTSGTTLALKCAGEKGITGITVDDATDLMSTVEGLSVWLIAGVIGTPESILEFVRAINDQGGEVRAVSCVVSHELGAEQALARKGIAMTAVFTGRELAELWRKDCDLQLCRDAVPTMLEFYEGHVFAC